MMGALARINRRGACPALAVPMQTGDGLLARLNPMSEGLTAKQLIGLCESAGRHGNGIVEVTARGSLQIRGLSSVSAAALGVEINRLDIEARTGTAVTTGPLAGLDRQEMADPRRLAAAIRDGIARRGLAGKLAPKVSVVVDGGGIWGLAGLQADVRCSAESHAAWRLTIGYENNAGRDLGLFREQDAAETALAVLEQLAARGPTARGRELDIDAPRTSSAAGPAPLGVIPLTGGVEAVAVALPFGSMDGGLLADFVRVAERLGAFEFRPAPPRSLIALLKQPTGAALLRSAGEFGLITDPGDPVMRIFACPGMPACGFGHFDTRGTARAIAEAAPALFEDGSLALHVSGCAKGCAHPAPTTVTLVGGEKSVGIVVAGTARSLPLAHSRPKRLAGELARLATRLDRQVCTADAMRLAGEELSAVFGKERND